MAEEIQGCQDAIIIVFQYSCKLKAGFRGNKLFNHKETCKFKAGYKLNVVLIIVAYVLIYLVAELLEIKYVCGQKSDTNLHSYKLNIQEFCITAKNQQWNSIKILWLSTVSGVVI